MKQNIMLLIVAVLLSPRSALTDEPLRAVIDLSWEAGQPVLTFDLTSGTDYCVEERTNLVAGAWECVGIGCANSGLENYPLTISNADSGFYRLSYEEDIADAEEGEAWGTFDFNTLSNRVYTLQNAQLNAGYGGLIVITNYAAGSYETLTHEITSATGTVTTIRQLYEATNSVYQHLTFDTLLDFSAHPLMMTPVSSVQPLSGACTLPGGVGMRFPGGQAFQSGSQNQVEINVRGNVVTAGNFQYDFGGNELLWEPPSIGDRIRQLWLQGPPPFDPYPPQSCGDAIAICNARMFSVLDVRLTKYSTISITETYEFLFDYCYEYTCPNGPLRKILVVFFHYSVVVRDNSGKIIGRNYQRAYFVGNETP